MVGIWAQALEGRRECLGCRHKGFWRVLPGAGVVGRRKKGRESLGCCSGSCLGKE